MTPHAMAETAILLGAFVAAAGSYGLLYCLFRLWNRPALRIGSYLSCAALYAVAAILVMYSPLYFGWKVLIAASCAAYTAIPPVTWRYLTRLHREERISNDTRPARRANRNQPGLYRRS